MKNSGLGCHINSTYIEALSYADDTTLSCPSVQGLNTIMNICSDFATLYGIDICNADRHYCLLCAKPICLKPDHHA